MKHGLAFGSLLLTVGVVIAACSSEDDATKGPSPSGPDSGKIGTKEDGGLTDPDGGRVETELTFPEGATFEKRDCTLKVRWDAGGNEVKLAGEHTTPKWAEGAVPLTKNGSVHEITIAPGPGIEPGKLYGYKLIVDGNWKLDPKGPYRKIVDGQMNSGLLLPTCDAGPETRADRMKINGGEMKVRVTVRTAADADPVDRIAASLDNAGVPSESFKVDPAAGAVDFTFANLPKGKHTLSLRTFDKKAREAEIVDLPFWIEDEPFDWKDGILYMMMIDRFANGDPANDRPVGAEVHYDADWHGGDLQGALEVMKSGYFERLGVRTIWLSPLNAQTDKWQFGTGDQKYSAYHGYWPIKSRAVEPRFGGDAALKAFVAEAHKRGLRVLLDLINNQVHDDHEYVAQNPSWFRKVCKCAEPGCGWSERPYDCLFERYLPDIDWTQAGAEKQFIADAENWISAFDLDGFRVDAVKHVESNSVYNMRAAMMRRFEQGGARIFMVGETAVGATDSGDFFGEHFASGYDWIDAYTGPTALDGQFDFPTRHNMADGLVNGDKPLNEVENEIRRAETTYRPGNYHVRFLNGHDNKRIASIAAKDPKRDCAWSSGCRDDQLPPLAYDDPAVYVKLKRALTVLYTLPGVPYLYQGDEVAFAGGDDPDMRRNMLFGETLTALQMKKPGTSGAALTAAQLDLREWVRKLGATRTGTRALRRGERKTLLSEGDLWAYAYQANGKEIAIVVVNRGGAITSRAFNAASLQLGTVTGWKSALGNGAATMTGTTVSVSLGAGEAAIFVAQ